MGFNQASLSKLGLAGQAQFGTQTGDDFQNRLNQFREATQGMSEEEKKLFSPQIIQNLFPSADSNLVGSLVDIAKQQMTPEYQERMLEMADKYQTRKGVRQTAFNMFGSGMDNLMKGIGMSMNPYGTPEALQNTLAIQLAGAQGMGQAYNAMRTPLAIPAVQGGSAPTYF